jgi:magnesium chelatase subunit D
MGEIWCKKKLERKLTGKRQNVFAERAVRHIGSAFPGERINDVDIVATIRAAAFHQKEVGNRDKGCLSIRSEDIREKLLKKKISFATVILIDSSGSITRKEMERLKGMAYSLIEDSYQKRDKVGLVAFRNHQAQKLMPLCPRSYFKQAMECIRDVPSGGGTPLASGLLEAARLLSCNQKRYAGCIPVIILMSDGKANIPTSNRIKIKDEIRMICRKIRSQGFFLVFIDTDMAQNGTIPKKYEAVRDILKKESWSYYHVLNISHQNTNDTQALDI